MPASEKTSKCGKYIKVEGKWYRMLGPKEAAGDNVLFTGCGQYDGNWTGLVGMNGLGKSLEETYGTPAPKGYAYFAPVETVKLTVAGELRGSRVEDRHRRRRIVATRLPVGEVIETGHIYAPGTWGREDVSGRPAARPAEPACAARGSTEREYDRGAWVELEEIEEETKDMTNENEKAIYDAADRFCNEQLERKLEGACSAFKNDDLWPSLCHIARDTDRTPVARLQAAVDLLSKLDDPDVNEESLLEYIGIPYSDYDDVMAMDPFWKREEPKYEIKLTLTKKQAEALYMALNTPAVAREIRRHVEEEVEFPKSTDHDTPFVVRSEIQKAVGATFVGCFAEIRRIPEDPGF